MKIAVLCPLGIELVGIQAGLRAAGLLEHVDARRTGPGAGAMRRAVRGLLSEDRRSSRPDLVILAGCAGALVPISGAVVAGRVISESGQAWKCWRPPDAAGLPEHEVAALTVVGVDRVVFTPAEKLALRERTGAHLVDTESHALAEECAAAGQPFVVVRGVSDGPGDALPREVAGWIGADGMPRMWPVFRDLVLKPKLISELQPLAQRTKAAMRAAAERVVAIAGCRV